MSTKNNTPGSNDFSSQISSATSDDVLIFDRGSDIVTANINQAAVDLQGLNVQPGFFGAVGGSGTSLQISVSNVSTDSDPTFIYAGSGPHWRHNGVVDKLIIKRTGDGVFEATGGTWTLVMFQTGSLNVASGADLVTYRQFGGVATIDYDSTAITSFIAKSGHTESWRSITTCVVHSGASLSVMSGTNAPVATTIDAHGMVDWRGGSITTVNDYGGFVLKNAQRALTIGTYNKYHAGELDYNADLVTISAVNDLFGQASA